MKLTAVVLLCAMVALAHGASMEVEIDDYLTHAHEEALSFIEAADEAVMPVEAEGVLESEAEAEGTVDADSHDAAVAEAEAEAEAEADAAADAEAQATIDAETDAEAAVEAAAEADVEMTAAGNCMTQAGLTLVKGFESFYARKYKDVAGIWTIGYGTLCSDGLINCNNAVTEPVAAQVLSSELLKKFGPCVTRVVKCPLTNNQFSALVSFAYNAGCGAMQTVAANNGLGGSKPKLANVPANMLKYEKARVNGVLQVVRGLTRRRQAEVALFKSTAASPCMAGSSTVLRASTPSKCVQAKGTCGTAAACAAKGGKTQSNMCPGDKTIVCCLPKTTTTPTTPSKPPATNTPAAPTGSNCMSVAGLALVKSFEGFYPKEYKDVAGIPTIGYGTLCRDNLIRCPGPVSEPDAARVLGNELLRKFSPCVRQYVKAPLNNNQFSALVSFAYNAGCGAMQNVIKAAGLNKPTGGNYAAVPGRMALYNKATIKGKKQVVNGLVRRRAAEGNLFKSTASSNCMPNQLKAGIPGQAAPVVLPGQPAPEVKPYDATDLFNLRAGEVDLPSGTEITIPGVPNATPKKLIAKADIADRIRGHNYVARNRGPVGKWSKQRQNAAEFEPVQNA